MVPCSYGGTETIVIYDTYGFYATGTYVEQPNYLRYPNYAPAGPSNLPIIWDGFFRPEYVRGDVWGDIRNAYVSLVNNHIKRFCK